MKLEPGLKNYCQILKLIIMKLTKYFIAFFIISKLLISCTKEDIKDITAADRILNQTENVYATGDDEIPADTKNGG